MAPVLYFLGFLSILLGAAVGADGSIEAYSLGLSLSVAYQALIGGVLLFVMARLLQYAAATAFNTEKFYQHALHAGATADATQVKTAPEAKSKAARETASETSREDGAETSREDGVETSTEDGVETSTEDGAETSTKDGVETSTKDGVEPAKTEPESSEQASEQATPDDAQASKEVLEIVEKVELHGYMIDKLSDGKVTVYTAEGPMQFESLEIFIHELELSNR